MGKVKVKEGRGTSKNCRNIQYFCINLVACSIGVVAILKQ
jgi:hypothetical protein